MVHLCRACDLAKFLQDAAATVGPVIQKLCVQSGCVCIRTFSADSSEFSGAVSKRDFLGDSLVFVDDYPYEQQLSTSTCLKFV